MEALQGFESESTAIPSFADSSRTTEALDSNGGFERVRKTVHNVTIIINQRTFYPKNLKFILFATLTFLV